MYSRYAELRDAKGLTDYKVAQAAGIARSTFSDWKNGRSEPKTKKLLAIANILEVPLESLVSVNTGEE